MYTNDENGNCYYVEYDLTAYLNEIEWSKGEREAWYEEQAELEFCKQCPFKHHCEGC
jgi:hypothetical protein